jgi:peptide/nickel transport system permease protein
LGLLLLLLFSVYLRWFPIGFSSPIGMLSHEVSIWQRLYHLALPALTLSFISFSNIALHTRQKLIDVLNSDYVLFAKARGESGRSILLRHGLRNILLPFITLQFTSFSELFGGSVLVETVFAWPGVGRLMIDAINQRDVNLACGCIVMTTILTSIILVLIDVAYAFVDPRIKAQYTKGGKKK